MQHDCNMFQPRSSSVASNCNISATSVQHEYFQILESKNLFSGHFQPFYQSRKEWGLILGCDRTSIWRWEQEIIRLAFPILREYRKSIFLDNYQRFILALIHAQRQGWLDGKKREYCEIKNWLKLQHPHLTREQFNNWVDKNGESSIPT